MDILNIHNRIKCHFKQKMNKLVLDERLKILLAIDKDTLRPKVKNDLIHDIEKIYSIFDDIDNYYFYELQTFDLFQEYLDLINGLEGTETIDNLVIKYMDILRSYFDETLLRSLNIIETFSKKTLLLSTPIVCTNCNNAKDFIHYDENLVICLRCNVEIYTLNTSSINDISRINISNKYVYDRKVHFKDCLEQYQAKQNTNINPQVYENIERELVNNGILKPKGVESQGERFKNITRQHVIYFLKLLGYTKYYEDVILIHYILTGQQPDNIEHLESKLIDDFNLLIETYDKLYSNIKRKNFISSQYVLFQLLRKHNYPCKKDDFAVLKTMERKDCHDEICKTLFDALGWDYLYVP